MMMSPLGLRSAKKKAAPAEAAPKAAPKAAPVKSRGVVVEKPKADIYTVMLILSFVAIVIGCLCLYGEMNSYGFDLKAR
jgi:hypothetical protein